MQTMCKIIKLKGFYYSDFIKNVSSLENNRFLPDDVIGGRHILLRMQLVQQLQLHRVLGRLG